MRRFDFITGEKRLRLAMDTLTDAWRETCESWNDSSRESFQREYLDPLPPYVKLALDATQQIADVIGRAERDCGGYDGAE